LIVGSVAKCMKRSAEHLEKLVTIKIIAIAIYRITLINNSRIRLVYLPIDVADGCFAFMVARK